MVYTMPFSLSVNPSKLTKRSPFSSDIASLKLVPPSLYFWSIVISLALALARYRWRLHIGTKLTGLLVPSKPWEYLFYVEEEGEASKFMLEPLKNEEDTASQADSDSSYNPNEEEQEEEEEEEEDPLTETDSIESEQEGDFSDVEEDEEDEEDEDYEPSPKRRRIEKSK